MIAENREDSSFADFVPTAEHARPTPMHRAGGASGTTQTMGVNSVCPHSLHTSGARRVCGMIRMQTCTFPFPIHYFFVFVHAERAQHKLFRIPNRLGQVAFTHHPYRKQLCMAFAEGSTYARICPESIQTTQIC